MRKKLNIDDVTLDMVAEWGKMMKRYDAPRIAPDMIDGMQDDEGRFYPRLTLSADQKAAWLKGYDNA